MATITKKGNKMNKYKMAVSCGRGMGIVKNTSKTWGDIVKKLSTHVELDDKEKAQLMKDVHRILTAACRAASIR